MPRAAGGDGAELVAGEGGGARDGGAPARGDAGAGRSVDVAGMHAAPVVVVQPPQVFRCVSSSWWGLFVC